MAGTGGLIVMGWVVGVAWELVEGAWLVVDSVVVVGGSVVGFTGMTTVENVKTRTGSEPSISYFVWTKCNKFHSAVTQHVNNQAKVTKRNCEVNTFRDVLLFKITRTAR